MKMATLKPGARVRSRRLLLTISNASRMHLDVAVDEQYFNQVKKGTPVEVVVPAQGLRPVATIYSTFLQRAFDQIVHDVALQDLPVVFAIDRGGLAGADGATHHGWGDLSWMRAVRTKA